MSPADDRRALSPADLERLLGEQLPALRAYVRLRIGPVLGAHESSADIVQSVCRELVEAGSQFQFVGDAAFRGWLFSAALNKLRQRDRYWHADKRDVARSVPDGDAELLHSCAHLLTPSREVSVREQVARLERAFAELSEGDRELVALARIAGLPHAAIAKQVGRSEEACRQGLRRALVRLAALLDDSAEPPERP